MGNYREVPTADTGRLIVCEQPNVYFVGNAVNFSDSVLRIAEMEFAELGFSRVTSVAEAISMASSADGKTLAIIVDESLLDEFMENFEAIRAQFPNTILALAYRNLKIGRKLLLDQLKDKSLARISFLPMNVQFDSWVSILRLILGGDAYLSRELWADFAEKIATHQEGKIISPEIEIEAANYPNLTDRELEVLSLVAEGKQNKIIANELNLSEHTVKLHIHHVIVKLDVGNRTEATAWFYEHQSLLHMRLKK